jgi:hypothetical protein
MRTATDNEAGALHPKFQARLREANLFGAFTEVTTPRFHKYLLQPKHILRNGWLLDPELELGQRQVRVYVLGESSPSEDNPNAIGQRLEIDRQKREATLMTFCAGQKQTIRFDMAAMEVIDNRLN